MALNFIIAEVGRLWPLKTDIVPGQLNSVSQLFILTGEMSSMVSHIYRESNTCADCLASYGYYWWEDFPCFNVGKFASNKWSLPK